jgi:hypothetical protein
VTGRRRVIAVAPTGDGVDVDEEAGEDKGEEQGEVHGEGGLPRSVGHDCIKTQERRRAGGQQEGGG